MTLGKTGRAGETNVIAPSSGYEKLWAGTSYHWAGATARFGTGKEHMYFAHMHAFLCLSLYDSIKYAS